MTAAEIKQAFCDRLKSIYPISNEACDAIEHVMEFREFSKGEYLFRQGERNQMLHFIYAGLVKADYIQDGKDITWNFFLPGDIAVDFPSFLRLEASELNYKAVESVRCISFHKSDLDKLFSEHLELNFVGRILVEQAFMDHHSRNRSFLLKTPEERYVQLIESRSEIAQKIPQRHIATYIGIKPESLSRLKKRLHQRKS